MTSGPLWALALSKKGAIKAWRDMMGPTNTLVAREKAPRRCAPQRVVRCVAGSYCKCQVVE